MVRKNVEKNERLPWYSFSRILSFNAYYNMVLGARGTGKTFGAKVKGIKDALNKGTEFIYLRRYKEDMKAAKGGFFADIVAEGIFPDYDFKIQGNAGFYAHADTRELKKRPWKRCVIFQALSTAANVKSVSFPDVNLIIYDEFIIDKGNVQYLANEARKFDDFYSTVDRYKGQVRVLFLSNSVSIMNPYFLALDVEPKSTDEFLVIADGFVAIHLHKSEAFEGAVYETPFGKFIKGKEYADYAVGNFFADNDTLMIAKKTSGSEYRWTIELPNGNQLSIWYERDNATWYAQKKQPGVMDIHTLIPENISPDKTLLKNTDYHYSILKTAFRHGRLYFDSPQSRNAFRAVV